MNFALINLRNEHKLSQRELGVFVGCSDGTISKIELGKIYPSMELAIKLANFFDITIDELVGRKNEQGRDTLQQKD
ncbi:MAG: helix-turn-helix transcriptional regulator [Liquorilactobacillus mali]|uniref:helix-turn-helix transcriptional regulator n=1 Tax=Liquorilactobacillus mali TaxID=1618 RepID=UPI0039EBBA0E